MNEKKESNDKLTKPAIYTATSPDGVNVYLEDSTWTGHILVRHPEMKDFQDEISETVATPDYLEDQSVCSNEKNTEEYTVRVRTVYYKRVMCRRLYSIKTVVARIDEEKGRIITAHGINEKEWKKTISRNEVIRVTNPTEDCEKEYEKI